MPRLSVTDTTSQELEPPDLEHSTSYEETQSWRAPVQPRSQRPRAPTLPPQTSQGSSTHSIPPSSSACTSPSHPTFQPTWTRQPSCGSSTLASPPPSALLSTENSARAGSHAASWFPVSEKPRGENSQRPQTPPQGREHHLGSLRCARNIGFVGAARLLSRRGHIIAVRVARCVSFAFAS